MARFITKLSDSFRNVKDELLDMFALDVMVDENLEADNSAAEK